MTVIVEDVEETENCDPEVEDVVLPVENAELVEHSHPDDNKTAEVVMMGMRPVVVDCWNTVVQLRSMYPNAHHHPTSLDSPCHADNL